MIRFSAANPYTERPQARRARKAWDLFVERYGTPKSMWYNPPCWKAAHSSNANWGCWVATYSEFRSEQQCHYIDSEELKFLPRLKPWVSLPIRIMTLQEMETAGPLIAQNIGAEFNGIQKPMHSEDHHWMVFTCLRTRSTFIADSEEDAKKKIAFMRREFYRKVD